MDSPTHTLIGHALRLALVLPVGVVQTLAAVIAGAEAGDWRAVRMSARQAVPQPHLRTQVTALLNAWEQEAAGCSPAEVAMALRTAALTAQAVRKEQQLELVWTGPRASGVAMRRTDQALLQVIEAAKRTLLVVSFAVYKIPAIGEALVRAAGRGVLLRICVEAPEPSGQKMAYDTIRALGPELARRSAIYVWPSDQRPADQHGRTGLLHAKCAVADEQLLFVSSANLTDHAMNRNIELGLLVAGGPAPQTVVRQFERLIGDGVLLRAAGP